MKERDKDMAKKRAFVTGASRGIGKAIAIRLAHAASTSQSLHVPLRRVSSASIRVR